MSKKELMKRVYDANMLLPKMELIKLTWGNVSEIDRELGLIAIKPSGVPYGELTVENIVVTDLEGNPIDSTMRPSSDLKTHILLYKKFKGIKAIVHTHSPNAVAWSQSGKDLPVLGTTHADAFYGSVPVTRQLSKKEVVENYEYNTGEVIVEIFDENKLNPEAIPGALVRGHGPFTWGLTARDAVENSLILEELAKIARYTLEINKDNTVLPDYILDKHYYRKHGREATYGQDYYNVP